MISRTFIFSIFTTFLGLTAGFSESRAPSKPVTSGPTVPGNTAVMRGKIACAPANAPENVKRAIWALNRIVGKPYRMGGGHKSFDDHAYDCSGTVSYALHHAGLIEKPMPSSDFSRFGKSGRGRWITVYVRSGHVFAVIAGLRLDTTDRARGGTVGPGWHLDGRDLSAFEARHPEGV